MKRVGDFLNWVLILGLVVAALWAWPRLPDRIPTHFGASGQADAWGKKAFGSWFMIPGIALALTAGMGWLRGMMARRPGWVNLPDRTSLADLPEVARRPVVDMFSGFLALIQTEVLIIFSLVQLAVYRTAMGQESRGIMILVLIMAIVASPFLMVVFFLRLQGAMDRGKKLAAAEGSGFQKG